MSYVCRKFLYLLSFFIFLSFALPSQSEANIILKVLAVNPSKDTAQKVAVKAYLPKETKPEHIVDKQDLDAAYDSQQGSYYVYGEYELKPGETIERDVELRDIWFIEGAEIETLRSEANKLSSMLKNTEFGDRVEFLKNSIDSKLNQISESQKATPANPERHISDYRENLKILESAKADLALARNLLSQIKPFPTAMVWRLIIAIVLFLGILGASFYYIWQKQVKVITHDTFYVPPQKEEPEGREQEEKKAEETDIEDIIKNEGEE